MLWVFDLDGVVWLAGRGIPGSAQAIDRLRQEGHQVAFVTNNSTPRVADHVNKLAAMGVLSAPDEIVTSAQAAASLLPPATKTSYVGGPGVAEALEAAGVEIVGPEAGPDTVVVGRSLTLDFAALAAVADALRGGARFVATNSDATFPTPDGLEPGAGALVAYLQVGSGRTPTVAGKPEQAMADLVRGRFGQPGIVVGDRAETDGLFAARIGVPFGLVLTGVTKRADLPISPEPAHVADDLAGLVGAVLGGAQDE